MSDLGRLRTPALLLDRERLDHNLRRMQTKADRLGVALRPHVKTHKSIEIASRQRELGARGITVSTLYEARTFIEHGFDDVTWAFPVILSRLDEIADLAAGATLRLVVDSPEAVAALESIATANRPLHVWLKVDCGYHRAGVDPESSQALDLAKRVVEARGLVLDGLLTHSGQAYGASSRADLERIAAQERDVTVALAQRLRAAGVQDVAVSIGSTPAMAGASDLAGVDEVRPGNYALYDWQQVSLGSCEVGDCAVSVLASVVSSNLIEGAIIDAGALALSKDLGPSRSDHPCFGRIFDDYERSTLAAARVVSLSQEHGVVDGEFTVGERLRILPNHSCLTVAQFDEFTVVSGGEEVDRWTIRRGRT